MLVHTGDINVDVCNMFSLAICQPQWGNEDNVCCHLLSVQVHNVFQKPI